MNTRVPDFLYPYVLAGAAAVVAAVLAGLNRSLKLARWPDSERQSAWQQMAALLLAWAALAVGLSAIGFYQGSSSGLPTIQYGVGIPIAAGILLYLRWGTLRRALEATPQSWIVGVQVYRTLGLIFIILHLQGRMPGAFAWPAGVNDVLVGLFAPVVALAHSRRWTNAARWVRAWNWFGLADLLSALTTGFLTSPSPVQKLAFDSPNVLISAFPLVLVPVLLVPLSILLHLASLKKLQQAQAGEGSIDLFTGPRSS
jgi:hypothetical protein